MKASALTPSFRRSRGHRVGLTLGVLVALLLGPIVAELVSPASPSLFAVAWADDDDDVEKPENVEILASPIFGPQSLPGGGWGEILVRITNDGKKPYKGRVVAYGGLSPWSEDEEATAHATFSAASGATVSLRLPVRVSDINDPAIRVYDEDDRKIHQQAFVRAVDNRTILVDVAKTSALGSALRDTPVGARFDPFTGAMHGSWTAGSANSTVDVVSPAYDVVTGDPLLPRRAAGYARVSAVMMRSEELVRLPPLEMEALATFVASGGTLGVIITRPEDLRAPVLVSLCGNAIRELDATKATRGPVVVPVPNSGSPGMGGRTLPPARAPGPEVDEKLESYEGGNLTPSLYGGSAPYGLGEVHILGFDPQTKPAVDSAWVHLRMVDLLRRANERMSGVLFRPGSPHGYVSEVRQQLDPNESSRWSILLSAMLLLAYAMLAGPGNFAFWRKKGQPLRALIWLPVMSLTAFASIVVIGVVAKGCSGRARHLTVIEAGAGMDSGTARRWRGFFVPSAQEMDIHTGSASSILGTEQTGGRDDALLDAIQVDREGLHLQAVQLRPWETLVVREDGLGQLGEGIAIVGDTEEVEVINRSGHTLVGLVLFLPFDDPSNAETFFLDRLEDGQTAKSDDMKQVKRVAEAFTTSGPLGLLDAFDFNVARVHDRLDDASPGLHGAWNAVLTALPSRRNWFPVDVPVLLAAYEDGEGKDSDSGLSIDQDRVLVRVVGWGGEP